MVFGGPGVGGGGVMNLANLDGFLVSVLLGQEACPGRVTAADLSGDGLADGRDIAPFVQNLLGP